MSRHRQDVVIKQTLKEKRKRGCDLDSSVSGEDLLANSDKHINGTKNVLAVKSDYQFINMQSGTET